MVWFIFFLLQAYVIGFFYISNRARKVLKLADEHWDNLGSKTIRTRVDCCHRDGRNICLFEGPSDEKNKEEYLHYSRNFHLFWFIASPFWADICSIISFVKFMIKDINPRLALVFEQDLKISMIPELLAKENLTLKEQIRNMQTQLDELALAKKSTKRKRTTKKK